MARLRYFYEVSAPTNIFVAARAAVSLYSNHGHRNQATYAQLYLPVRFIPIVTSVLVTESPAEEME